jgi:hypothetical protein
MVTAEGSVLLAQPEKQSTEHRKQSAGRQRRAEDVRFGKPEMAAEAEESPGFFAALRTGAERQAERL